MTANVTSQKVRKTSRMRWVIEMLLAKLKTSAERLHIIMAIAVGMLPINLAYALDPPHDIPTSNIDCVSCHVPHGAPGGTITKVEGNPNLCMACHNPVGDASARSFVDSDQALPGLAGTSHRWDSGPSGHVEAALTNTSPGSIRSGGVFSGRIERTYTISISSGGESGIALFDWSDSEGNSASGVLSGDDVPLADGLSVRFIDGGSSPSFQSGDSWTLNVRTDLRLPDFNNPDEKQMAARLTDPVLLDRGPPRVWDFTYSKVVCSVCHDQHSQKLTPFDPAAPGFGGAGTGAGRHFQRHGNAANEMCVICHSPRNVQSSSDGSHPVGVTIPVDEFQSPATLPLDPDANVVCMSCHTPHFSDSGGANGGQGDGYILRQSINDLCLECHTLADQTNGSHFDNLAGALWPGGQYGSSFPPHSRDKQGACVNCHWPHGWPDNDDTSVDFERLWVERYDATDDGGDPDDAEDLCYTCHDGDPAQANIRADFLKGANGSSIFHHPVMDSEQGNDAVGGGFRTVECVDCHNPHKARGDNRYAGISGTNLDGSSTPAITEAEQYKLCFNCHGDSYNQSRDLTSNKRLDFNTTEANSGYHPVTQAGRNQSANLQAQLTDSDSGLTTGSTIRCTDCHNSDVTGGTPGPVVDSSGLTQGPHGSTNAAILRANFSTNYTGQNWNNNNAALCFLCHDQNRLLARERSDGARTNFYNGDRDNLHWYHLTDKDTTASCLSCHYDIHSNRTADNTQYRWRVGGQWFTSTTPPENVKSHLVNFAPDVQAFNFSMPRWQINTETGQRRCDLSCHGGEMDSTDKAQYEPPAGDEPSHTY